MSAEGRILCNFAPIAAVIFALYFHERQRITDPTTLVIIDEADRLKVSVLEEVRDIFDKGGIGVVFIGMPGIEKRLSRYPQLYSRVGFVHAFRPLSAAHVRQLLQQQWVPSGVALREEGVADEEARTAIIRVTGGNFRLLHRLLTQIARLVEINTLQTVTRAVVEAARESLVIGTARPSHYAT
jgi:DNA transposition AAA+ family ATPase